LRSLEEVTACGADRVLWFESGPDYFFALNPDSSEPTLITLRWMMKASTRHTCKFRNSVYYTSYLKNARLATVVSCCCKVHLKRLLSLSSKSFPSVDPTTQPDPSVRSLPARDMSYGPGGKLQSLTAKSVSALHACKHLVWGGHPMEHETRRSGTARIRGLLAPTGLPRASNL
jgi:hypothetical protein